MIEAYGVIHELPLQLKNRKMLLPKIIGKFKMQTSKEINKIKMKKNPSIWQRNYYEHIIKNDKEYEMIYNYIMDNPKNWQYDRESPYHIKKEIEIEKIIYKP